MQASFLFNVFKRQFNGSEPVSGSSFSKEVKNETGGSFNVVKAAADWEYRGIGISGLPRQTK